MIEIFGFLCEPIQSDAESFGVSDLSIKQSDAWVPFPSNQSSLVEQALERFQQAVAPQLLVIDLNRFVLIGHSAIRYSAGQALDLA